MSKNSFHPLNACAKVNIYVPSEIKHFGDLHESLNLEKAHNVTILGGQKIVWSESLSKKAFFDDKNHKFDSFSFSMQIADIIQLI